MPEYMECLDCDKMIPVKGDKDHKWDGEVFIGCEGYRHPVALRITPEEVMAWTKKITEDYKKLGFDDQEDYSDAFSYIGELYSYISARMVYNVYESSPYESSEEVMGQMKNTRDEAHKVAVRAMHGLSSFGITK